MSYCKFRKGYTTKQLDKILKALDLNNREFSELIGISYAAVKKQRSLNKIPAVYVVNLHSALQSAYITEFNERIEILNEIFGDI